MPHVQFTRHLSVHFPDLQDFEVEGTSLAEVVAALDRRQPGLAAYLVDDRGRCGPT